MEQFLKILTLLMPLVLAWVGYSLDAAKRQIAANEQRIEELKTQSDLASAELHQRIDKVKVINDYMEVLAGPDTLKRRLAIHVVMIVLPEEGPALLREIAAGTDLRSIAGAAAGSASGDSRAAAPVKQDRDVAADALATRRDALLQDLFSDSRPVRLAALAGLRAGWLTDESVFPPLVKLGQSQLAAKNVPGVFNAVVLINNMMATPRGPVRADVVSFAQAASANSPDTAQQSRMLLDRLR